MIRITKSWAFPLAMLAGVITYPISGKLEMLTPYLIFFMLLFTFARLSPSQIRFRPAHGLLLLVQIGGGIVVYALCYPIHPIIAQGAMACVLAPTATSAAVVTGMLGGNVGFITSYMIFCNTALALIVPILFPALGSSMDMPFWESAWTICRQVMPMLILPLAIAWIIRYGTPRLQREMVRFSSVPFYLWAIALTIVTARTVKFLIEQENPDYAVETGCALVALIICIGQFYIGRKIGKRSGDPVSSGQGLMQKNTILAIWMAQAYLNPISSVAPAAYVLWQNIINSWQLWKKRKKELIN